LDIGQTSISSNEKDLAVFFGRIQENAGLTKPYRSEQVGSMFKCLDTLDSASHQQSKMQKWTVAKIQEKTDEFFKQHNAQSNINWLEFFQQVFAGTEIVVTKKTQVFANFASVFNVLYKIASSDQKDLANALNFQFASVLLQESTVLLDHLNTFKCTEEPGYFLNEYKLN